MNHPLSLYRFLYKRQSCRKLFTFFTPPDELRMLLNCYTIAMATYNAEEMTTSCLQVIIHLPDNNAVTSPHEELQYCFFKVKFQLLQSARNACQPKCCYLPERFIRRKLLYGIVCTGRRIALVQKTEHQR